MAFERAPALLGVGDRSPHDDAVGAALLNVHDEHRAVLPRPLRAGLERRWLKVRITRHSAHENAVNGVLQSRSNFIKNVPDKFVRWGMVDALPWGGTSDEILGRKAAGRLF